MVLKLEYCYLKKKKKKSLLLLSPFCLCLQYNKTREEALTVMGVQQHSKLRAAPQAATLRDRGEKGLLHRISLLLLLFGHKPLGKKPFGEQMGALVGLETSQAKVNPAFPPGGSGLVLQNSVYAPSSPKGAACPIPPALGRVPSCHQCSEQQSSPAA